MAEPYSDHPDTDENLDPLTLIEEGILAQPQPLLVACGLRLLDNPPTLVRVLVWLLERL